MDLRGLFMTLIDGANEAFALSKKAEGDAAAGGNYTGMLVGKDGSGNLKFLKTNTQGELVISEDSGGIANLDANGLLAGTVTEAMVAEITLQNSKVYKDLSWVIGCFRDSIFRIVHVDDEGGGGETTTSLVQGLLAGSGDFSDSGDMPSLEFTSGAVGVQKLKVLAKNLSAPSGMRASIAIKEEQF